ncbi:MAG TPA: energy transducer TonB [Allosphingosinicella sp.]|nr:energy transducer TonB [Allosphingosinicella sp.]
MTQGAYLETKRSPTALTIVVLMHGAAITALAMSKMDVISVGPKPPTTIIDIPNPPPPPVPPEPLKQVQQPQQRQVVTQPPQIVQMVQRPVEFDTSPVPTPAQPYVQPGPVDIILPPAPPSPPPPAPQPKKVESARAKANLASYVSNDDYPASAVRNEEQGTTRFQLTVGPDGRVADCRVTGTSGSNALDTATCRLMKSRARFTPARDSDGKATGDSVYNAIRWVLPD